MLGSDTCFSYILPCQRKRKKYKKQTNLTLSKTTIKWSEYIMHKDISTKFGVNPRDGFRENSFNGRTEGYQPRQQHYYAVTQGRTIN